MQKEIRVVIGNILHVTCVIKMVIFIKEKVEKESVWN